MAAHVRINIKGWRRKKKTKTRGSAGGRAGCGGKGKAHERTKSAKIEGSCLLQNIKYHHSTFCQSGTKKMGGFRRKEEVYRSEKERSGKEERNHLEELHGGASKKKLKRGSEEGHGRWRGGRRPFPLD